jgi:hypothetical protein
MAVPTAATPAFIPENKVPGVNRESSTLFPVKVDQYLQPTPFDVFGAARYSAVSDFIDDV